MMSSFWGLFLARRAELLELFIQHMNMTSLAVFISLLIGVPLGIIITKNSIASSIVIGIANLMQSIPAIALLAFSVPFLGIGTKPAVVMVVVYALLPIIKNTYTGIISIDPRTIEASKGIGLSRWQQLVQVQLPIAAPFIMAGIRISAVTSVGSMTIAAFAGAGGLGWFINLGLNAGDPNLVLLGAIPASLLALFIDYILARLERVVTPEGLKPPEQIHQIPPGKRMLDKVITYGLCGILVLFPILHAVAENYGRADKTITVGSTNFTEAITLGYIYSELIEKNTDIHVTENFNLNGSILAFSALENGDIDMYTEYTGTALANLLHLPMNTDPDEVYKIVSKEMKDKHNIYTSAPLGFNNTYVMSVTPETAKKFGLSKLSDLKVKAGRLRLGCTVEFSQRPDSLPKMEQQYGIHFKDVKGLEGNIRYQAVASGKVDITDAYSTDALLKKMGLVTLRDDLQFFPPYYAVNFVRPDAFKRYPELKPLLSKLDGLINEEKMMEMNYMVDVEGKNSKEVAHNFLLENGLIQ